MEILDPPGLGLIPTWQWLYATWFGAGLVVPLRAGLGVMAMAAILIALPRLSPRTLGIAALVLFALGVHVTNGIDLATGIKDDRRIVVDEVVAFMLGAAILGRVGWQVLLPFAAVFLFLDRLKPWPFVLVEQVPAGWGVMLDDAVLAVAMAVAVVVVRSLGASRGTG